MMLNKDECKVSVLCPFSFGIALGVTKGLFFMLFLWAGYLWGYGLPMIDTLGQLYAGVTASFVGGLIGFLWGFLVGFIFGVIAGFVYDLCVCCKCHKSCSK